MARQAAPGYKAGVSSLRGIVLGSLVVAFGLGLAASAVASEASHSAGITVRPGPFVVTIPRGLRRHNIGVDSHLVGIVISDLRSGGMFDRWARSSALPPAGKVALQIEPLAFAQPIGVVLKPRRLLHLPLSLAQPWYRERLRGGARGYRFGDFRLRGQLFTVFFWSGRAAPARDRAAVTSALGSIRPAAS